MKLKDKVFVVTGGASGLGRGVVEAAMEAGARVGIFDMNAADGKELADKSQGRAIFATVDVSSAESAEAGIAKVMSAFGRIDVCVNCAGIGFPGRTFGRKGALPLDAFRRVIEVNLIGTFNMIRLAAAEMAKNEPEDDSGERGVIVNTASGAAWDGQMGQASYSASKAGVVGMTLPIARDLSNIGIRIMAVAPGPFDTAMMSGLPDDLRAALIADTEFPKRLGLPSEFAALVLHIAQNQYLNGDTIRLDAGTRMRPR